jgi:hypothetical protein
VISFKSQAKYWCIFQINGGGGRGYLGEDFTERFGSGSGQNQRSSPTVICGEREEEMKKEEEQKKKGPTELV